MIYGALLLAGLLQTFLVGALLVTAAATAALVVYYVRRARSRELAPAEGGTHAVNEMRSIGDRIETLVSQQQLQGETQRARLGQQIDEVRQVVGQQGHRVDGLRGELRQQVQRQDQEIETIRRQLTAIQRSALPESEMPALPAPQARALPPAAEPDAVPEPAAMPEPVAMPEPEAFPEPVATPEPSPEPTPAPVGGDSFGGFDALPPRPEATATPAADPFASDGTFAPDAPAPQDTFFAPSAPATWAPASTPAPSPEPAAETSVFSDVGFDAFSPGEPAEPTFAAPEPAASTPEPAAPFAPVAPPAAEPAAPANDPFETFADEPAWDLGTDATPAIEASSFDAPAAPAPASAPLAFAPAAPAEVAPAPVAPPAAAPAPARPPEDHAWVTTPAAPSVPVFTADEWDLPAPTAPEPTPEPVVEAFVPPPDADDFLFISTVNDDVQRALYMAGVTKLEEIAHWSRGDARRIASEVGVSEETIMNQWVFEAQGALFERYSSHVGG